MDRLPGLELGEAALPACARDARRGEVVRGHRQQLGLQRGLERAVGVPEVAKRVVEDVDGGAEVATGGQRTAELERDLTARADLGVRAHGLAQVRLERVALAI